MMKIKTKRKNICLSFIYCTFKTKKKKSIAKFFSIYFELLQKLSVQFNDKCRKNHDKFYNSLSKLSKINQ